MLTKNVSTTQLYLKKLKKKDRLQHFNYKTLEQLI